MDVRWRKRLRSSHRHPVKPSVCESGASCWSSIQPRQMFQSASKHKDSSQTGSSFPLVPVWYTHSSAPEGTKFQQKKMSAASSACTIRQLPCVLPSTKLYPSGSTRTPPPVVISGLCLPGTVHCFNPRAVPAFTIKKVLGTRRAHQLVKTHP